MTSPLTRTTSEPRPLPSTPARHNARTHTHTRGRPTRRGGCDPFLAIAPSAAPEGAPNVLTVRADDASARNEHSALYSGVTAARAPHHSCTPSLSRSRASRCGKTTMTRRTMRIRSDSALRPSSSHISSTRIDATSSSSTDMSLSPTRSWPRSRLPAFTSVTRTLPSEKRSKETPSFPGAAVIITSSRRRHGFDGGRAGSASKAGGGMGQPSWQN